MIDTLGDRMKMYEGIECDRKFMPGLPIVSRLDGRNFSKFTAGLDRPFDSRLHECMVRTTKYLVDHTVATCGYTQSDEITLVWGDNPWFDGRIFKMTSQLAAQATLFFFTSLSELIPEYAKKMPTFDARVWSMPNKKEATNVFLWRELDATKNSISMAAQHYFSHKKLHGKNSNEKQDMLMSCGVNWNDYPESFKRGTYILRRTHERKFTEEEILVLPDYHEAKKNPEILVKRQYLSVENLPIFGTILNREQVIFENAIPRTSNHEVAKPTLGS